MLKYNVYHKVDDAAHHLELRVVDPTSVEAVTDLRSIAKNKDYWVSPVDEDAAYLLLQSPRRGRSSNWSPEMVAVAHELRVEENYSDLRIQLELLNRFDVEVSSDSVKKTLRQETNVEVPLKDGLREKALAATPSKKARGAKKRMTSELKAAMIEDFKNGMNGVEIGKKYGFSSSYVNTMLRNEFGYRKKSA